MKYNPVTYIKNYVCKLQGNARVCMAFHPFWGIPYTLYYFYLSLYMKEYGVTDTQLGLLMLAGSAASIFFSLAAAPLVDNLGRKRTTLWFDLISSAVPPLIYAISGSFWISLAAMVLSNANKIMGVSYYLVMTEDADDEQRYIAFNLFNIIIFASGILIPVAGFFVNRCGLVATERFFLIFAGVSMTALIIARNHFLRETAVGKAILEKQKNRRFSLKSIIEPYKTSYVYLLKQPAAVIALLANVIFYVYYIVGTNNSLYFTTYFIDGLGLKQSTISVLGSVYALGMLLAMVLINPLLQKINIFVNLIIGAALNISGLIMLVTIPRGSFTAAIISIAVTSIGFGAFKSVIDAAMVITTEGEARTGIYSIANLLSSVFGMLAAGLSGILYPINPKSVYIMSIIMLFITIISFSAVLFRGRNNDKSEKAC